MPTDMHQLPREEFIERNLGLVHACAGRFKGRGIEYEELYAAGCLGLVKACDGFDTGRGVCFSTYAVPVILGGLALGAAREKAKTDELAVTADRKSTRLNSSH